MSDLFNKNKTRAPKSKGMTNTMANNAKNNVTAADVVAQAAEEKLVEKTVPAQSEKTESVTEEVTVTTTETESPELTVLEGGKKTFKERLTALAKKVEENKKLVVAVGVAAAAATVAIAKIAAKKSLEKEAAKEELEYDDELNPAVDPVTGDVIKTDESVENAA